MSSDVPQPKEVLPAIEEALSDRFTRDIFVHDEHAVIIARLGGQYGEETCERIRRKDVEPAVPDEYECKTFIGFFEDAGRIEIRHPDDVELVEEQRERMADGMRELLSANDGGDKGDE